MNRLTGLPTDLPQTRPYSYSFSPIGCHPEDKRDFQVTLMGDFTLVWDDATSRSKVIGGETALLLDILGGSEVIPADDPFLVRTQASVGVITMIDRIKTIQAANKHLYATTVKPLDDHLNEIFWLEVNPQLEEPVRPRTYG